MHKKKPINHNQRNRKEYTVKKFIVLLTFVIGFAYSQASQTVSFVEIQKQGISNTERDNGYTWGRSNFFRSKVIDLRNVDSLQLFATAPDSFAVGITAVFYNTTDTTNGTTVAILDSLTNITSGVYGSNPVVSTLTSQFWVTLKSKVLGGVPAYVRFVYTFNTTKNHDLTVAAALTEYWKPYAKIYSKLNVLPIK